VDKDVAANDCWVTENKKDCPFVWYKNIVGRFFGLVTNHACDGRTDGQTDGRTDGQNYDSQDRAGIAASRGKNCRFITTYKSHN